MMIMTTYSYHLKVAWSFLKKSKILISLSRREILHGLGEGSTYFRTPSGNWHLAPERIAILALSEGVWRIP